jgi:hypothetical protein
MKQKYRFRINDQGNKILNASREYGHDASIVRDEEDGKNPYCFFTSPHLTPLTDPEEIWARGLSLLSIFRGATNIYYYNPLAEYDHILQVELIELFDWETDENITPHQVYDISQDYPFDASLLSWHDIMVESNPVAKSIFLSKSKEDVLTLLLQLGNGLDWISLYSILDSLKTYSATHGKDFYANMLDASGHNESDISAFTGTANNYGLIGVAARHGEKGWSKPKRTVNLKEAQCIIGNLCRAYLNLAHSIK